MRIEKKEKKDYIEILEAVKITQEGESILLEKGDRIKIVESGDPGSVFQRVARDFGINVEVDRGVRGGKYILKVHPNSFVRLSRVYDDILKGFYSEISDKWNVIWDQDNNEEIIEIF